MRSLDPLYFSFYWLIEKKRILTLSNHSLRWISLPVKPATTIVVLSLSRSTSWATGPNRTTTDRDESSCWKKNGTFYRFIVSLILVARLEQIRKSPLALLKLFYGKPLNPSWPPSSASGILNHMHACSLLIARFTENNRNWSKFHHDTWHRTMIQITYHNQGSKKVESQHVLWAILLARRDHFLVIMDPCP